MCMQKFSMSCVMLLLLIMTMCWANCWEVYGRCQLYSLLQSQYQL